MWNSRSVSNKILFIQSYILSKLLDIICITETWLTNEHFDSEILPIDFCIYRRDRESRGGGILIGVKKSIPSRLYSIGCNAEFLAIEISTKPTVLLCCVYVPPNSPNDYYTNIISSLRSLSTSNHIIILGDFNTPDINWNSLSGSTFFSNELCELTFDMNLSQLITTPTHKHGNILDLVFTNLPGQTQNLQVDNSTLFSDHFFITFDLKLNLPSSKSNKAKPLFNYSKTNLDILAFKLSDIMVDPNILINPENLWRYIKDTILHARDISTPMFRPSPEHPRWLTPDIRHLQKKIITLNRSIRRSPTNAKDVKLSSIESTMQNLCQEAKYEYEISLIKSFKSQPRKLYSHLSRLKSTKSLPLYLKDGDIKLFDDTAKANSLNTFFNSTFSVSDYTFPQLSDLPKPLTQLNEITFDSLEVYKVLSKLDTSKAMGIDTIHPHLLKMSALLIYEPVTSLFNNIMQTQLIPKEWKTHKIIPIPKTSDTTLVNNYRPISLLCILSKVLEN